MAKKSKIAQNERRREIVARYADRRAELKRIIKSPSSSPEVRAAAATALGELAEGGDLALVAPTLNVLVMDVDPELANAAELALTRLADRLDRPDLRASTDF